MKPHIAGELAWLLSRGPCGRRGLARATGLGEIVVRRELERLERLGFVALERRGTRLTPRGREEFAPILIGIKEVKELQLRELALDRFTLGAALAGAEATKGRGLPIPSWRLRDLAIREGASGAILMAFSGSRLIFSDSGEELSARNPQDGALLRESFPGLEEGDLLVLVSAPERKGAHLGLWRIIIELLLLH